MKKLSKDYQVFSLANFKNISQMAHCGNNFREHIRVVGHVLPFKVNNYILDELINWDNIPDDPIFQLTFPQRGMLSDAHYRRMEKALSKPGKKAAQAEANAIRRTLNPNPAGQTDNIPEIDGMPLTGIQHKYDETCLFFPSRGQTCHAYCTFCFRWPQFTAMNDFRFAMKESDLLLTYLKAHSEITDILFTGGDPMVMSAKHLEAYLDPIIHAPIETVRTIRIGSKSLSYWPYRYLSDSDADAILRLFEKIVKKGFNLAFMAHFTHPAEMKTPAVREAVRRIQSTGAIIRTQSPLIRHINDDSHIWQDLWTEQVRQHCVPYYMFVARDTGAQDYFAVTLEQAYEIFRNAYKHVSGIARTVRGPIMSCSPGKVHLQGVTKIGGKKFFALNMVQGRDPEWVDRPFFAEYNADAVWLTDLKPAFGEEDFFFNK